jgi:hypothetical protein
MVCLAAHSCLNATRTVGALPTIAPMTSERIGLSQEIKELQRSPPKDIRFALRRTST